MTLQDIIAPTRDDERFAAFRSALLEELEHTALTVNTLEIDLAAIQQARRAAQTDDASDPEGGAAAFEYSQTGAQRANVRAHADHIVAALARLDAGTFGECVRCHEQIAPARLEARPSTPFCIDCTR